jgi:hypothetical protein
VTRFEITQIALSSDYLGEPRNRKPGASAIILGRIETSMPRPT